MSLAHGERLLWLAALLPLLAFCVWRVGVARRRRRALFGALAPALARGFSAPRRLLRDGLALCALGLLVLALAGPLLGTRLRQVEQRGVDVMVVLDVSRSMLARDLPPSRLERAKREVRGLLEHLAGDRAGLVTFAGDARLQCPLTHDATTFRLFLDDADVTSNALGGTAVGEGLELALRSFEEERPAQGVVLLLTDGEDHTSDPAPDEVALKARARGIPVHVVAFGSEEGGTIPVTDDRGREAALRDAAGEVVISRPDPALLREIAATAEGAFLSAESTPFPLDELWEKRLSVMPGVTRAASEREEGIDRYQWAVALALLCLLVRAVLRDGAGLRVAARGGAAEAAGLVGVAEERGPATSGGPVARPAGPARQAAAALLLALLAAPAVSADEQAALTLLRQARAALDAGEAERALELLHQARVEWPESDLVDHTLGDAYADAGNAAGALAAYERGANGELRFRARFNQGVVRAEEAARSLREAGVPAEADALPDEPDPGLRPVVEGALSTLRAAREDFLDALATRGDAGARESLAAINHRIDELQRVLERLPPPEEPPSDEQQESGPQNDEQQQDEPDEQPPDESDEPSDEQQGGGTPPPEEPSDEPAGEEPQQGEGAPQEAPAGPDRNLSPQELSALLEQLEDLEERAHAFDRVRRAARRQTVEKDW